MNPASELAVNLAACLCRVLREDGSDPCFCGVLPGDATVADYVGDCENCGMAWVRMTQAYPASAIGVVNQEAGNCATLLGMEFEVGILRCFTMPEQDGSPPSAEDQLTAAVRQHSDMLLMQRAIACCDALGPKDYILGSYAPTGPMGLVYGGTWQLMVAI